MKGKFSLGDHPVVVILGLIASVIAIFSFFSGIQSIRQFVGNKSPESPESDFQTLVPDTSIPYTPTAIPRLRKVFSPTNTKNIERVRIIGEEKRIRSFAISHDSKLVAVGEGTIDGTIEPSLNRVMLYEIETGNQVAVLEGHTDSINSLSFSDDGQLLASASRDWSIIIWDVSQNHLITTIRGFVSPPLRVRFLPNADQMLVTTENSITKLDVNGTFIYTLDLDSEVYINGFDISPDASMFAVSFHKGGVRDGKIGVWDTETGNLIEEIVLENSFGGGVAFSPDGVFLACGESDGWETAQVKLYSTSDWNLYRSLSADSVIWKGFSWDPIILFSPNNSLLIWHYVDSDGTADASIKFWNGSDFSPVFKFYWEGSSLNDLKMSPDGTYLLAALGYGVRVYEIK